MLLRFIGADGQEQDIADIDGLYAMIQAGGIGYDSLVRDDASGRWVKAADHPLFKRIREIAARQQAEPAHAPPAPAAAQFASSSASVDNGKTKARWFAAITSREEALKTINETATGFFALAAIQTALGLFLMSNNSNVGADALIDVPIYIVLAAWLKWGRSRIAAVLLLVVASISAVTTILGMLKIMDGGRNIWLAVIVLWAAIKAVEATFRLRGRFKDATVAPHVEPVMSEIGGQ